MPQPSYIRENIPNEEVPFLVAIAKVDEAVEKIEVVDNGDGTSNILVYEHQHAAANIEGNGNLDAEIAENALAQVVQTEVPFAQIQEPLTHWYWPIITNSSNRYLVSHKTPDGDIVGREGRIFKGKRSNGRYHVGVDLFCHEGDEVVACAGGRIVNFYPFYKTNAGEQSYALLVDHGDFVINYGEVKEESPSKYGWQIGDDVRAATPIAHVSSTSMLHFETYASGTTTNKRWFSNHDAPPVELRDPTHILLRLAGANRAISFAATSHHGAQNYTGPLPNSSGWVSRFGGRKWRYDFRGVYTKDQKIPQPWRTEGPPSTCRKIFNLYGTRILEVAEKYQINPALIMMTIATETGFLKNENFTGSKSFRWEPKPTNKDVSPQFDGAYSAGPTQTLSTSVRDLIRKKSTSYGLEAYDPFTVAPALPTKPNPVPPDHPLYDPDTSIELGTAYIRSKFSKTRDNPILVAAAYNAGSIRQSPNNLWRIRVHDDHLDRAAKWYGDACAVLSEQGIF